MGTRERLTSLPNFIDLVGSRKNDTIYDILRIFNLIPHQHPYVCYNGHPMRIKKTAKKSDGYKWQIIPIISSLAL